LRGTGREIDGSPLIALACKEPFTHYYFVDADTKAIEALKARIGKRSNVHFWAEDCNVAVKEIARQIPPRSLSLAFVDPTSVQMQMSTIAELADCRRVDLLINFPEHMSIQRIKSLKCSEADLDAYFGSPNWKSILERARARGEHEGDALREVYKDRLKALGYEAPRFGDQLIRSDQRRPLYYLLYASKHERGIDFWRKITKRSHAGQEDFIGPTDE
ncbi:three-Cys-motif partner protein TcmP, partial [Candidatus Sumerlaeota bacterium]|nr:three-Cys-motif partner protein TcmP [Candidatus Sumerlaeota bacterium]